MIMGKEILYLNRFLKFIIIKYIQLNIKVNLINYKK